MSSDTKIANLTLHIEAGEDADLDELDHLTRQLLGEIQEMEVVQQQALLTMGWCIDCHRTTKINSRGNAYYDKLVELHDGPDPMTVEDIGGLECAKCHY